MDSRKDRRGYYPRDIPRQLEFIECKDDVWEMPRGFISELTKILWRHRCFFMVDSETKLRTLPDVEFEFNEKLWEHQEWAATAILCGLLGGSILATGNR